MPTSTDTTVIMPSTASQRRPSRSVAAVVDGSIAQRRDLVRRAIGCVPLPSDPLELRRCHAVTDALARGDGSAALIELRSDTRIDSVPQPHPSGPIIRLDPAIYAVATLACRALMDAGLQVEGSAELQRLIRHQIRIELIAHPLTLTPLWVVPGHAGEHTAAHVAALILAATGQSARPWLWAGVPPEEDFLLLGEHLGDHPFATLHTCVYTFDLPAIVRHFLHV